MSIPGRPTCCAVAAVLLLTAAAALLPWGARAEERPAGKIVYVRKEGDRYALRVMRADGTEDRALAGVASNVNLFPTWSPDGKKIAYTHTTSLEDRNGRVGVVNADGTGQVTLPSPLELAGMPAWSPDGKQIAFVAADKGPEIHVANADGTAAFRLNTGEQGGILPFWSRDAKTIGFTRDGPGVQQQDICLARLDGTGADVLIHSEKPSIFAGSDALSRDGRRLLYMFLEEGAKGGRLRLRDLQTKTETDLLELALANAKGPEMFPTPTWAPDGKSFVLGLATEKGVGLFQVSEDGKTRKRLTPEGVDCAMPSWTGTS